MSTKELRTYLVSPIPESAVKNAKTAIDLLRNEPENKTVPQVALKAIVAITQASLDHYFIRPIEIFKLGMISSGIVKMGINAGIGVLNTFGKRLIASLNQDQLILLADVLEKSMVELVPLDID